MKKITSFFVALAMLATMITAMPVSAETSAWGDESVATAFAGGTGTTTDPYLISNAAELRYANDLINSGATYQNANAETKYYYAAAYKLTADIDMGGTEWIPIGWYRPTHYDTSKSAAVYTPAFTGKFDGNKHVISNIRMNWDQTHMLSSYMGFFGYCNGATISNLGLDNIEVVFNNYDYVYDTANSKTTRIANSGVFAGQLRSSTVTECYVINSKVTNINSGKNDASVAGFVGALNYGNKISNCYVYNAVIRAGQLAAQAGFAGILYSNGNAITNCYSAKISCDSDTNYATTYGFLYSYGQNVSVTNCYSTMQDAQGDHISKYDVARIYNPAHLFGETGVPAETLICRMKETGAYAQRDDINDGYPHLYFETVKVKPDYIIKSINKKPMTLDYTGEKGSFSGKLVGESEITVEVEKNTDEAANVYIASYDIDGRVINAKSAAVNKADFSFTADVDMEKAKYLKVFLWDSNFGSVHEPYSATSVDASGIGEMWPYVAEIGVRKTNVILMGDSLTDSVWNGSSYSWPKYGWEGYIGEYFDEDEINLVKHGHGG